MEPANKILFTLYQNLIFHILFQIEVEIESLSSRNQDSPELTISPDPDSIGYEQDPDSLEENNNYNNDYIDENDHQYQNEGYVEYEDENETDFDIQFRSKQ